MALSRNIGLAVAGVAIAGAVAVFAIVWRPAIAASEPPAPQSFDPALVKRGRALAATGNCADCHTRRGEKDFAGGLPVPTPFGTIYSSNITPDPETGIGRWPEAAFTRAMRSGVDREVRRRRGGQLARLCDQCAIAVAGAVGCGGAVLLFAERLASRPRRGARADGAGGQQSLLDSGKRRARHRSLHGRDVRRADAGS